MKNPLLLLLIAACLVLGSGWFFTARSKASVERSLEALGDSAAIMALEREGYVSAFAAVRDGLLARDSAANALENALKRSESLRYARAEVSVAAEIDTVFVGTPSAADPQVVQARVAVDPFFGTLEFHPPTDFALALVCSPRLEQYIVQSASDKLLVGVRALSPRTEVRVEAFDATPYLRSRDEGGLPWWSLGLAALGGAIGWEIAR